jgi:sugar/nucleoside kinase (ribokinase family)
VTDDIRVLPRPPVDLLVVAGLTIDVFGEVQAVGGAARYATEAAHAAGLRVALHTVAGPEPMMAGALDRLADLSEVSAMPATTSIVFEHHGAHDRRRLRLRRGTEVLDSADAVGLPPASAVLFAPVAAEVSADAVRAIRAPLRAAGLQGWLRQPDADGWVGLVEPERLAADLAETLRDLDLLFASREDLDDMEGPQAVARLRAWAGPGPQLVVTAGVHGAWVDAGDGDPRHVPAEPVEGRNTIGAGDAFAAVLTAGRGSGLDLATAAAEASTATALYLATRTDPTAVAASTDPDRGLADLDGTEWRARRFGAGLEHEPPDSVEFSLEVRGDRVAGRSGCNRFMGGWQLVDDRLRIGPLAGTMMYCDGLMDLEAAYLTALQDVADLARTGDQLILIGAAGDPVVEYDEVAPVPA